MLNDQVAILDGGTFVISDRRGDIDASPASAVGLFHDDMRYLSRFVLTVDGATPTVLSVDDAAHYAAQFFLVQPSGSVIDDAQVSIIRRRWIDLGFRETITVLNHRRHEVELALRIDVEADFADLFEVKEQLAKTGDLYRRVTDAGLVLGYRRGPYVRETLIRADDATCALSTEALQWTIGVPPRGERSLTIEVRVASEIPGEVRRHRAPAANFGPAVAQHRRDLDRWSERFPAVESGWKPLDATYRQAVADLAALRLPTTTGPDAVVPAAGLPWFMCLFGRDSIITSYQALPFAPDLAEATLRLLGLLQARDVDEFRDAEPGKIMHESRSGELTAFEQRPHSPYYGSVDATPLFLILLDEYERWTGDEALVHELQRQARAALAWLDRCFERFGGYVAYQPTNTATGLENQCWKDSPNSILFADGTNSCLPRATCEVQGYVYDAKLRVARLARTFWGDAQLADRLEREAAELRERFNRDFWIAERGHFALALDGDGRQVDALTSNIGHLLWSGIVEPDRADDCRRHLLGPRLFSGWGVRTMAEGEGGYNPVGYHNGTVWPHDNALIAHGLRRYGYRDDAAAIVVGILEAGSHLRHRLPEAFAGYPRSLTGFPVEFPTACNPQAWASAATLLFIRTLLGLELDGFRLGADPALPDSIGYLCVAGVRGRWGRTDVDSRQRMASSAGAERAGTLRQVLAALPGAADPADVVQLGGSMRLDVSGGPSWHLSVTAGHLVVCQSTAEADCVIRGDEDAMMRVYRNDLTPTIAALQGFVSIQGDAAVALRYGELIAAAGRLDRSGFSQPTAAS